jgi:SAM-dependent methyltransferase
MTPPQSLSAGAFGVVSAPASVQIEDARCPLGCPRDDRLVLLASDRLHHIPGRYPVVRCASCGLMRTNPRPTPETIGIYYPEDYTPFASTQVRPPQRRSPKRCKLLRRLRRLVLNVDPHRLPAVAPGRLLEIGCGSGNFLARMKKRGWDVAGIEASRIAAASAQAAGLAVRSGRLECAPDPVERYDLVAGWEVLEHLHDPVASLGLLARWTVPRGWLALSVPDAGSIDFAMFTHAWYGLDVPRHLFHFTLPTLTAVLRRGGWDVDNVFWHKNPKNLLVGLASLGRDRGWVRWPSYVEAIGDGRRQVGARLALGAILGWLRASGHMTIWARRA